MANIFQQAWGDVTNVVTSTTKSIVSRFSKTNEQKALAIAQDIQNAAVTLTPFIELIPGVAPFEADIAAVEATSQNIITKLQAIVNAQKS